MTGDCAGLIYTITINNNINNKYIVGGNNPYSIQIYITMLIWYKDVLFDMVFFLVLIYTLHTEYTNGIGGVMVRLRAMVTVDRGFEPRSVKTEKHEIGICCFSFGVNQKSFTQSSRLTF